MFTSQFLSLSRCAAKQSGKSKRRCCDVICCWDTVDEDTVTRLNGRRHLCCLCRPRNDIEFDNAVHLSCSDVVFFWLDFTATIFGILAVSMTLTAEEVILVVADMEGYSSNLRSKLTAAVLGNLAVRITVQFVKSVRLLNVCRVVNTKVMKVRIIGF